MRGVLRPVHGPRPRLTWSLCARLQLIFSGKVLKDRSITIQQLTKVGTARSELHLADPRAPEGESRTYTPSATPALCAG